MKVTNSTINLVIMRKNRWQSSPRWTNYQLIQLTPIPLHVYCGTMGNSMVDRELLKMPMFVVKAPELQAEERDKHIAIHQGKIAAHEVVLILSSLTSCAAIFPW